jgi:hypothetical protein
MAVNQPRRINFTDHVAYRTIQVPRRREQQYPIARLGVGFYHGATHIFPNEACSGSIAAVQQ